MQTKKQREVQACGTCSAAFKRIEASFHDPTNCPKGRAQKAERFVAFASRGDDLSESDEADAREERGDA
jgi:hypothetical protein